VSSDANIQASPPEELYKARLSEIDYFHNWNLMGSKGGVQQSELLVCGFCPSPVILNN
jgi:hypothetical protein